SVSWALILTCASEIIGWPDHVQDRIQSSYYLFDYPCRARKSRERRESGDDEKSIQARERGGLRLLRSGSRHRFRRGDPTETDARCRSQWCAVVQGRSILAEAAAQSMEHAAGDGRFCRSGRPHLVLESCDEGGPR